MIQIDNPANCCGCSACASVCRHDAIEMQPDALGFLYPKVDTTKCVECGLCERVCAFKDDYDKSLNLSQPMAYGARHKNMGEVATSRSGAAFIALSDCVLEDGGVVYGVGYTDHFRVVHKRAVTKEQRDEFKGSKYVQSDLSNIFRQVRDDLKNGLTVLFSGTPCQTAGLHSYVGTRLRRNLILVDIVCHGVPSPYYWRDYLAYIEQKKGSRAIAVNFRDKSKLGWKAHKESFTFEDGHTYTYTYTFYQHIMFRRSCGVCHFTNLQRPSDITIADFWGWEKTNITANADDKGLSLVLCNTDKGVQLFNVAMREMNVFSAPIENCMQPNLVKPSSVHPLRDKFEQDYIRKGFIYVMKRYGDMGWRYKVQRYTSKIKRIVKRIIARR